MDRKICSWLFLVVLVGCGEDPAPIRFDGEEYFPPPAPNDTIPPAWRPVVRFGVKDRPTYDAVIEVLIKGIRSEDGRTRCELMTEHRRFRSDRSWSPLPLAFYSVEYKDAQGREDLSSLFRETLDFYDKRFDQSSLSTRVTFTRSKTFTANWQILPILLNQNGSESCSALAELERNSQVACRAQRCIVKEVMAHVDAWRHFLSGAKPEREKDDLSALELRLTDLGENNSADGAEYSAWVPEFK